jgi:hypothetical protein
MTGGRLATQRKSKMGEHLISRVLTLGAAALAIGCGSGASSGFDNAGDSSSNQTPSADASPGDATVSGNDGGFGLTFQQASEAGEVTQGVCIPGVYQGQFTAYPGLGADGGVEGGIFSYVWSGNLSLDLKAQKITMTVTTNGGEGLITTMSTTSLEIAEGGTLDGSDMYGGSFIADLSGGLDCDPDAGPPYQLHVTLDNGMYSAFIASIHIVGDLTADYQAPDAGTPPMLVNGSILVGGVITDGGSPVVSSKGTWSATWVSP